MNLVSSMDFGEEYIEEINAIEILHLHMHLLQNREREDVENRGKIHCIVLSSLLQKM